MKNIFLYISLFLSFTAMAQHQPYIHYSEHEHDTTDAKTLQQFLRKGEFFGHARYFFMATDNAAGLSDYYANGFGMGIGYETGRFKNFQVGISGFFIYNIHSSDLSTKDAATGLPNRYEMALFDLENPKNHRDMDRLEDLYIRYTFKKSFVKFGKQHIKTPFINPQDGRMRPTLAEGVVVEWNQLKNLKVDAGWLYGISPRGTVKWYGIGKSMGVYPAGVNPDGTKSGYANNISSDALFYLGVTKSFGKNTRVQLWDQYVDNVFNTALLQVNNEWGMNSDKSSQLVSGAQVVFQQALHNGGNADPAKTFMLKNNEVYTYGLRLGYAKKDKWAITANYNHIAGTGRYLMPREWGRDPFFTFMPRERNEGFGNVDAMNVVWSKTFKKAGIKSDVGYGHFYLPDVKNTALNKYALPSYSQFNADIRYGFKGFLKGMELQFLYVYKAPLGKTYADDKYVFNKVNMSLYNVILNYHF